MVLRRTLGYRAVLAGSAAGLAAIMALAPAGAFADDTASAADSAVNWAAVYGIGGTSTTDNNYSSNLKDSFEGSVTLSDGTVVAAGQVDLKGTDEADAHGVTDAALVFYNADGSVKKAVTFGGSLTDGFEQVIATSDGNVVVVGSSSSVDGDLEGVISKDEPESADTDAIIAKYDSDGNLLAKAKFGGTGKDLFRDVVEMDDGSLVAVGYTSSVDGDMENDYRATPGKYSNPRDGLIVKFSSDLASHEFVDVIGGNSSLFDEAKSVVKGIDGGIVVAGYENSNDRDFADIHHGGKNRADGFVAVYDTDLKRTSLQAFGGTGHDYLTDIDYDYQNADGTFSADPTGYVLSGYTKSNDGTFEGADAEDGEKAFILRIDKTGAEVSHAVFGTEKDSSGDYTGKAYGESIKSFGEGYLLAGEFSGQVKAGDTTVSADPEDAFVAYVQPEDGTLALTKAVQFGGDDKDVVRSMDEGAAGTVVLTGTTGSDAFAGVETYATGSADAYVASLKVAGLVPASVSGNAATVIDAIAALPTGDLTVADATRIAAIQAQYDALNDLQKSLVYDYADLQAVLDKASSVTSAVSSLQSAIDSAESALADGSASDEATAAFKNAIEAARTIVNADATTADAAIDAAAVLQQASESFEDAVTVKTIADQQSTIDEQKSTIADQEATIATLEKQAADLQSQASALQKQVDSLNAQVTELSKTKVTTVTVNKATVNAAAVKAAVKAANTSKKTASAKTVTKIVLGSKVKKVSAKALKAYAKVKTVTVKSKKLTKKGVKNALKGSKVATVKVSVSSNAKTNKKYVKKYKAIFTKANAGKKVVVKAGK